MTWAIKSEFLGYVNKRDKTNLPTIQTANGNSGIRLIAGSKNVISTDGDLIATRPGYTLYGAANSSLTPIESSFEWNTNLGKQVALRSYDDELEFLFNDAWYKLADGWSDVGFNYTAYYDTTEQLDLILFVNGDSNIYYWNGAVTTFASATSNTITKQGTTTWAEEGFFASSNRTVIIGGIEYAYTGGQGTTTLTGVTPDPTSGGHSAGDVAHQKIVTLSNKPASGFNNDLIATLDNQVHVGSLTENEVYKAAVNDITNFTPDTAVGGPRQFSLDAAPTAFVVQEENMYISAGKSFWYQITYQLADDLTSENLRIDRLKSGTQLAAQAQSMVENVKNHVFFITNEPTLDQLGRVEDVQTPQSQPLSDDIKTDFDSYNFTGAHIKFFKNNVYIAVPQQSLLLIYNLSKGFWETPQTLPAGRLAIISDDLYLHSNTVPETYKLGYGLTAANQTHNDNGFAMEAIARFSYENFGTRVEKKTFTEFYNEFYISSNTELLRKNYFEYQGVDGTINETYLGSDTYALLDTGGGGIGKENLGKQKLAGTAPTDDLRKYRKIDTNQEKDFYEMFTEYSSNGIDYRWAILAFGPDVMISDNKPFEITQ